MKKSFAALLFALALLVQSCNNNPFSYFASQQLRKKLKVPKTITLVDNTSIKADFSRNYKPQYFTARDTSAYKETFMDNLKKKLPKDNLTIKPSAADYTLVLKEIEVDEYEKAKKIKNDANPDAGEQVDIVKVELKFHYSLINNATKQTCDCSLTTMEDAERLEETTKDDGTAVAEVKPMDDDKFSNLFRLLGDKTSNEVSSCIAREIDK